MTIQECLQNLVEIQYLKREEQKFLLAITNEEKRICALKDQRAAKEKEIETKTQSIEKLNLTLAEKNYHEKTLELKTLREHLTRAVRVEEETLLNKSIQEFTGKLHELETHFFECIEEEERLNADIALCKEFLLGIVETEQEISRDVASNIEELNSKLQGVFNRQKSLLQMLPPDISSRFLAISKKFPTNPISSIHNGACKTCMMKMNSTMVSQVEQKMSLETCPFCDRILLPSHI